MRDGALSGAPRERGAATGVLDSLLHTGRRTRQTGRAYRARQCAVSCIARALYSLLLYIYIYISIVCIIVI